MKRMLAILAALWCSASASFAQEVTTDYTVTGTGLDQSSYQGTAKITRGNGKCSMAWLTPSAFEGYCFEFEGALMGAYSSGSQRGLVFYKIESDGSLKGVWNVDGTAGSGTEILTPVTAAEGGSVGSRAKSVGAGAGNSN
jgi:hypothetical protein